MVSRGTLLAGIALAAPHAVVYVYFSRTVVDKRCVTVVGVRAHHLEARRVAIVLIFDDLDENYEEILMPGTPMCEYVLLCILMHTLTRAQSGRQ